VDVCKQNIEEITWTQVKGCDRKLKKIIWSEIGKVVLYLTKKHKMKHGEWRYSSSIADLSTRWRWVVSLLSNGFWELFARVYNDIIRRFIIYTSHKIEEDEVAGTWHRWELHTEFHQKRRDGLESLGIDRSWY
jgi:hypothetical protein